MNDRHCPVKAMPHRRRLMFCLQNLAMQQRRRRMLRQPNSASSIILPDEVIVEIISWLPVKTLMKLRCVNKFLKTTISDPHFVQMHLKKSSRNSQVVGFYVEEKPGYNPKSVVKVFTLGDNSWRDIQCFPVLPLYWWSFLYKNNAVYLSDLSTESYTQMLLPRGFVEVPPRHVQPT
ncbi:F-box protein, partial [Trifolium medium]|nr:F-box protein [Trifolium medium]